MRGLRREVLQINLHAGRTESKAGVCESRDYWSSVVGCDSCWKGGGRCELFETLVRQTWNLDKTSSPALSRGRRSYHFAERESCGIGTYWSKEDLTGEEGVSTETQKTERTK